MKQAIRLFFLLTCLGAGLIGCAVGPYSHEELKQLHRYESAPLGADEAYIDVQGKKFHYYQQGSGTPLVLLHDFPTSSYEWRHVIPRLAKRHMVIAPDLLGYGKSSLSPGSGASVRTLSTQAEFIARMLEQMKVGRAIIVGQGIGGGIAQILAVSYPDRVRGLVLINPVCFDSWPNDYAKLLAEPGWGGFVSPWFGHRSGFDSFLKQGVYHQRLLSKGVVDSYFEPWAGSAGRDRLILAARALDNKETQSLEGSLGKIRVPTLVIAGRFDPFQSINYSKRLAESIPGAQFIAIPECGHIASEDEPEKLVSYVFDFYPAG